MGFTTPCFIRKNTPELRKKLEELGYKYSTFDDLKLDGIITFHSKSEYSVWANYHFDGKHTLKSYIDCRTNEDLFLALAALRDDSDYMQWFVCPKMCIRRMSGYFGQAIGMDGHENIVGYEWLRHENKDNTLTNTLTERINEMIQIEGEDVDFLPHKATVEELITHFNNG